MANKIRKLDLHECKERLKLALLKCPGSLYQKHLEERIHYLETQKLK